jgi:predicted phage-related endonuclease
MGTPRRIGGSDIAAIVGVDSRRKPIDVWRRLVEGHRTEPTLAMEAGIALEPLVRSLYARASPVPLVDATDTSAHALSRPDAPWAVGHLDARRVDGRVVELKTASVRLAHEWGEGDDEVPDSYRCQVAWYQWLAGSPEGDLAVLVGNEAFRVYTLSRDVELENMLTEAAARFWRDHVLTRRPPPPDGSEGWSEWLSGHLLSTKPRPDMLPATAELDALGHRLLALDAELDALGAERRLLRQRLEVAVGDAAGVQGADWRAKLTRVRGREATDWEAVVREAGVAADVVARHTARGHGHLQLRLTRVTP